MSKIRIPLATWIDRWDTEHSNSNLSMKDAAINQFWFIKSKIAPLVWTGIPDDDIPIIVVVGEHRSRSVLLPVYEIRRLNSELRITMRSNFSDWKLSVESDRPIASPMFSSLFHTNPPTDPSYTGHELSSCYFEGFPYSRIFKHHAYDSSRWSASICDDQSLWTTIFLSMHAIGAIPPIQQSTRPTDPNRP
jgi:hypothetical protein